MTRASRFGRWRAARPAAGPVGVRGRGLRGRFGDPLCASERRQNRRGERLTRAAPAAILPAMQTVNLSAASAAMRAGASAGSGATMIALLLLVNLALAGAVSLPPLPSGARSAGAGLALDAVLLALLVAGVAFDLRRVWRADRRLGVQALGGAVGRVAEGLGCVTGLVLAAHLCPGSVGGVLGLGLAGLIVGLAVGDRLAERVRRALACRETPASCADEAEICGDPSAGATPAEQAEATREACASAEEARS